VGLIRCALIVLPGWFVVAGPATAQTSVVCAEDVSWSDPPDSLPRDVCGTIGNTEAKSFYALSWRLFKFLVWPASNAPGKRGIPDITKKLTYAAGPRTFETFKTEWETFLPDARRPADWNDYPTVAEPCDNHPQLRPGDLVLASLSKFGPFDERREAGLANLLVAQNQTYVRYHAAYNETVFDKILNQQLYDRDIVTAIPDAPSGKPVPDRGRQNDGALTVKSAWIELPKGGPNQIDPARFYFRDDAWIQDLGKQTCRQARVGLVGLHIVYKTPSRPQWIWSTFEHVNNVPESSAEAGGKFTFNNGDLTQHMTTDPAPEFELPRPQGVKALGMHPRPFQVERLQRVDDEVLRINAVQQDALRSLGSVWRHYKMVMTQWPGFSTSPDLGAKAAFPQPHACSGRGGQAAVNTTMETFLQTQSHCSPSRTCMGCHEVARRTDFVFAIVFNRNHPPQPPAAPIVPDSRTVAIKQLQDIFQKARAE
jgi:hypothetical protein